MECDWYFKITTRSVVQLSRRDKLSYSRLLTCELVLAFGMRDGLDLNNETI